MFHKQTLISRRGRAVACGLATDVMLAAVKYVAATATGSSAMYAEAVHSLMDASTELALLYGINAAQRPANAMHQFGFGREVYFWSFVAALLIFSAGAVSAFKGGIDQVMNPVPTQHATVSYVVLAVAFVTEVTSTTYALVTAAKSRSMAALVSFVRGTRDSAILTILFSGFAGLSGLLLVGLGLAGEVFLDRPDLDGWASIGIATILTATAVVLALQAKALLIGVAASPAKVKELTELAAKAPGIEQVNGAMTVQLSPEKLLVALSVSFSADRCSRQIEEDVASLEAAMRKAHPEIVAFFVKPQSSHHFAAVRAARGW
jgi:cation diffusion facilitator family transporter